MPHREAGPGCIAVLDDEGRVLALGRDLKESLDPDGDASLREALKEVARRARESGLADGERLGAEVQASGRRLELLAEKEGAYILARVSERGAADDLERLETFARLAEGMAHDARNPLNALSIHLGLLGDRLDRADAAVTAKAGRHLKAIRDQVTRIEGVLRCFMRFASPLRQTSVPVDLGELVNEAVCAFGHEARRQGVTLAADVVGVEIQGDVARLGEAVLHLVKGSIDEGGQGGHLQISVVRSGSEAVLELAGEGGGEPACCPVPAESERRVERLLSLAGQIVELHRGNLRTRKEGRSRRIEVRLPLVSP